MSVCVCVHVCPYRVFTLPLAGCITAASFCPPPIKKGLGFKLPDTSCHWLDCSLKAALSPWVQTVVEHSGGVRGLIRAQLRVTFPCLRPDEGPLQWVRRPWGPITTPTQSATWSTALFVSLPCLSPCLILSCSFTHTHTHLTSEKAWRFFLQCLDGWWPKKIKKMGRKEEWKPS